MARRREGKVETYFKDRIASIGGRSYKWVCPGEAGVMDQIVIIQGWTFFVEIKTGTGTLSIQQKRKAEELRQLGATVYTAKDFEGVNRVVQEILMHCQMYGHAARRAHAIRD